MLFHIFARINKGGIQLTHQQIRNSIYQSDILNKITNMCKSFETINKYKKKFEKWKNKSLLSETIIRILLNYFKIINDNENQIFDINEIIKEKSLLKQLNLFCTKMQNLNHKNNNKFNLKLIELLNKIDFIFKKEDLNMQDYLRPFLLESLISCILVEKFEKEINQNQINNLFKKISVLDKKDKKNPFYNNTNSYEKIILRYKFIKKELNENR